MTSITDTLLRLNYDPDRIHEFTQLMQPHTGEQAWPFLRNLPAHRAWEDWLLLALGALIFISPSIADTGYNGLPAASAVIVGLIIIVVAQFEIVAFSRWEEVISYLICGVWLATAPFLLGYAGQLRTVALSVRCARRDHHALRILARQTKR